MLFQVQGNNSVYNLSSGGEEPAEGGNKASTPVPPHPLGRPEPTNTHQFAILKNDVAAPKVKFTISVTLRSVEQVYYYLGEIARARRQERLRLMSKVGCDRRSTADDDRTRMSKPTLEGKLYLPGPKVTEPETRFLDQRDLFDLREQSSLPGVSTLHGPSLNELATYFGNKKYCVFVDESGNDRSSHVLALLSQLTALNNSAKDLPAPSAITLLSH